MMTCFTEQLLDRRSFLRSAALATIATHLDPPWASPPHIADTGELKYVEAGDLIVAYRETGPPDGTAVLLLHGWPYDIHTYEEVAPLLGYEGYRVITPYLRGFGATRFRSSAAPRNAQQSAVAADAVALLDSLHIEQAIVGGCDWGARTANILAALWPHRCRGMVAVSGYLIGSQQQNRRPLPPQAELQWWYQFYFATDRGRAGYAANTRDFNRLIWKIASPEWMFDDATYERTASAFDNPDHVDIVIHNYRWRLGLSRGEPRFDEMEERLAAAPLIKVPSITLEGDANGAPHPDSTSYAGKFIGPYAHRRATGGIGHNLPQEAPYIFADAIRDVDVLARRAASGFDP